MRTELKEIWDLGGHRIWWAVVGPGRFDVQAQGTLTPRYQEDAVGFWQRARATATAELAALEAGVWSPSPRPHGRIKPGITTEA